MTIRRVTRMLALATAVAAAIALPGTGASRVGDSCARARGFRAGALGAIAYWRGGALHVVDVSSRADRVIARASRAARAGAVSWSPDGRWVAFGGTIVPSAGGPACRPLGGRVVDLHWLRADRLAGSAKDGALFVGGPNVAARRVRGVTGVGPADPAGRRIAVGYPRRSLVVVELATGRRKVVYRSPSDAVGYPVPRAWSDDGRWILFQNDAYGSASIAADGLPLLAVRSSGGRPVAIEPRLLGGEDFLQRCGRGFVVSAGFDRYVTAHKRVDLVSPPSWRPRNVSRDLSRSWFSAACSPDGRRIAATVTRNRDEGRFDSAERSIWLLSANGSRRRVLVGTPGDRISDEAPRWSRDGRSILYVEHPARSYPHGRLYLVDVATGRRSAAIATIDGGLGYYGHHDWAAAAAWFQPS